MDYTKKRELLQWYGKQYGVTLFVETGSFLGDTAFAMKDSFEKVFTIELQEELAEKCRQRFAGEPKVSVYQGNSAEILRDILPELSGNTLFWLDAHYSSAFHLGNTFIQTARGSKDTPIVEELQILLQHGLKKNVILIDDARLFVGKYDYPTLLELKEFLKGYSIAGNQVQVKNDIIRITPR